MCLDLVDENQLWFFVLSGCLIYPALLNVLRRLVVWIKDSSNLSKWHFGCFQCSFINFKNLTMSFGTYGLATLKKLEKCYLIRNMLKLNIYFTSWITYFNPYGLVVVLMDSQARGSMLKTTGWLQGRLNLSSLQDQSNEYQDLHGM